MKPWRRLAVPEHLEDRALPGGSLVGLLFGVPLAEPFLGSVWADGNPLGSEDLPAVHARRREHLAALEGLQRDRLLADDLVGEVRRLVEIAGASRATADAYVEVARTRLLGVAGSLAASDAAVLASHDFLADLWWTDELLTSLARGRGLGAPRFLAELPVEGDDPEGMSMLGYGGYGNMPPVAYDDSYYTKHDTTRSVSPPGVMSNDYDPNNDPLTASLVSGPSHAASFTFNSNGSFTYTPAYHYVGGDSFVYRVSDGQYTDDATASINVTNTAPVANDDYERFRIKHDAVLSVSAPGVMSNDYDYDYDPITAILVTGPSHASSFTLNSNGSFQYTPAYHYVGMDSFTYKVTDGIANSNTATVPITVYNTPPVAVNPDGPYYIGFVDAGPPAPLVVESPGPLGNDFDADGDYPLTGVLYSGPSHGTLEYFNPNGSFKYVPGPGYLGNDSFQYLANDGLVNSAAPGTVHITTFRVDAMIYDGQAGPQVAYPVEESRGAFTVANKNDTDGDGLTDNEDYDGVIGTPAGRNEVDLMQLDIARPYPGFAGTMTLTVPSGRVVLWQESTKVHRVNMDDFGVVQFTAGDFSGEVKTVWAEVWSPSESVRDISMNLAYRGYTDTVKATGVWATLTAVEHDTKSANQLFAQGTPWANMPSPPRDSIVDYGGTGLRPIDAQHGAANVIAMQFTVQPANIATENIVFFDITRRLEGNAWTLDQNQNVLASFPPPPLPANSETPNDDSHSQDETDEPDNASGVMFSVDTPAWPSDSPGPNEKYLVMRGTFEEYMRVGITTDPDAPNALAGSRGSDKFEWHVRHRLEGQNGRWVRTTGDQAESDVNDIAPGRITIGQNP